MKVIKVDQSKCIGCGACVGEDDSSFEFNDAGFSTPIVHEVENPSEELLNAVKACPVDAITLEDVQEEEKAA